MPRKTAPINIKVKPEIKRKINQKAESFGLTTTALIEKIAKDEIVFAKTN